MRKSFLQKFSGKINSITKNGEIVNSLDRNYDMNQPSNDNSDHPKISSHYSSHTKSTNGFGAVNREKQINALSHSHKLHKKTINPA